LCFRRNHTRRYSVWSMANRNSPGLCSPSLFAGSLVTPHNLLCRVKHKKHGARWYIRWSLGTQLCADYSGNHCQPPGGPAATLPSSHPSTLNIPIQIFPGSLDGWLLTRLTRLPPPSRHVLCQPVNPAIFNAHLVPLHAIVILARCLVSVFLVLRPYPWRLSKSKSDRGCHDVG
jgi:hypothetical protein